jgi:hypothetical protein
MEHFVGIDVAKDRLDVPLRPSGETFAAARDGKDLPQLVERAAHERATHADISDQSLIFTSLGDTSPPQCPWG